MATEKPPIHGASAGGFLPAPNAGGAKRNGEHRQSAGIRERILDATLEVARTHGYRGLTIARVSASSGMPSGSVYWHFASKDQLLRSAMDVSFERHRSFILSLGPTPDESVDDYVPRVIRVMGGAQQPLEFWRIGAALIADETAPEVETQQRFLDIRQQVSEMYASWWRAIRPASAHAPPGYRPEDFAHLLLMLQDGLCISMAAGEAFEERLPAVAVALRAIADPPSGDPR